MIGAGDVDLQELVQDTLDGALFDLGVLSFWQRRLPAAGGDVSEYVVYTLGSGSEELSADDRPLVRSRNVTVRYYYLIDMLGTKDGRTRVKKIERIIQDAMVAAGFYAPYGPFEVGEIDERRSKTDSGYNATVIEFYYYWVV